MRQRVSELTFSFKVCKYCMFGLYFGEKPQMTDVKFDFDLTSTYVAHKAIVKADLLVYKRGSEADLPVQKRDSGEFEREIQEKGVYNVLLQGILPLDSPQHLTNSAPCLGH